MVGGALDVFHALRLLQPEFGYQGIEHLACVAIEWRKLGHVATLRQLQHPRDLDSHPAFDEPELGKVLTERRGLVSVPTVDGRHSRERAELHLSS